MIDYEILKQHGTTDDRLREFFTAKEPTPARAKKMEPGELKALRKDIEGRQKFEKMVQGWLQEHIVYSLGNHAKYSAVDMAWDSMPINHTMLPLMQYAQGRIDLGRTERALKDVPNGDKYLRRDKNGQVIGIDLPKFTEVNINLIRSVITRRVAAQAVKYNKLWPYYKYEPRDKTQVGKLRADTVSQRMDIMADQFDFRHHQTQETRDMFLYAKSVSFPRSYWERELQLERASRADEFQADGKIPTKVKIVKEGISWVNPHPSRMFYDNNYPLASLNTDTGCEYVGFWDVTRWGDIADNAAYFNRKAVSYTSGMCDWFSTYWAYFNQYFTTIIPPTIPQARGDNQTFTNDRKNQIGLFTGQQENVSTIFSHIWIKVRPSNWGWGDYPHKVWVHLKVAGDATVVYAKICPSSPCSVASYNENDSRMLNISLAHELMPFQDQLSNLFSQLLETIKADLFSVAVLNTDVFPDTEKGKTVRESFENVMRGKDFYTSMNLLEVSFEKLRQMGIAITADNIFKVVRATPNTAITAIFESIARVIDMADRLMVMSPHEQGQAASHEISATESMHINNTTDNVYDFIGAALDEARAAKKRILFESLIACGDDDVELPVANRYSDQTIAKAGFQVKEADSDDPVGYKTIMGNKTSLVHDYTFTSRDGGERTAGQQSATVLVQLFQSLGSLQPEIQNAIFSAMGKEKVFEIINEIFRMTDAGVDMKLELKPGESDELMLAQDKQVMESLNRLAQMVQADAATVAQLKQVISQIAPQAAQALQQQSPPPAA